MSNKIVVMVFALMLGAGSALAQETAGAGRYEVGVFPGGGIIFTQSTNATEPNFGNYAVGGSLTLNFNEWVGAEAEFGGGVGVHQDLTTNTQTLFNRKTPTMWMYSGNIVVNPLRSDTAWVPYLTAGVGGLTMTLKNSDFANLSTSYDTYFTENLGGGLKWYANHHFGIRADYRFFTVNSNDTAPAFFGQNEMRYGHRFYGGLMLTY